VQEFKYTVRIVQYQGVAQIPSATFISLPGFDHAAAFTRTDRVVPLITKFLQG
jgi:hypothetical protein